MSCWRGKLGFGTGNWNVTGRKGKTRCLHCQLVELMIGCSFALHQTCISSWIPALVSAHLLVCASSSPPLQEGTILSSVTSRLTHKRCSHTHAQTCYIYTTCWRRRRQQQQKQQLLWLTAREREPNEAWAMWSSLFLLYSHLIFTNT